MLAGLSHVFCEPVGGVSAIIFAAPDADYG